MVKFVVMYGQPADPAAFDEHYARTHVPLVQKIPNLRRFEFGKVLGAPEGGARPFYYLGELWFEDAAALQASLGSPEGQAASADVETFAAAAPQR